jgi:hypothetical protein
MSCPELAGYFREHNGDDTCFAAYYRNALADLKTLNDRGELVQLTGSHGVSGRLSTRFHKYGLVFVAYHSLTVIALIGAALRQRFGHTSPNFRKRAA